MFFGFIEKRANQIVRDKRGRVIIKLTDNALSSLKTAVETVGHELHHVRECLAGAGTSETEAEAAGKAYLDAFLKRLAKLN